MKIKKAEWQKTMENCVCPADCTCNCYPCKCILKRTEDRVTVFVAKNCCKRNAPNKRLNKIRKQ